MCITRRPPCSIGCTKAVRSERMVMDVYYKGKVVRSLKDEEVRLFIRAIEREGIKFSIVERKLFLKRALDYKRMAEKFVFGFGK